MQRGTFVEHFCLFPHSDKSFCLLPNFLQLFSFVKYSCRFWKSLSETHVLTKMVISIFI
jgi:hypothetical protein